MALITNDRNAFVKVREYLLDLGYPIVREDADQGIFVVDDEERGLSHVVLDCEYPCLFVALQIMPADNIDSRKLLELNNDRMHVAYSIDPESNMLRLRGEIQLPNLDANELDGLLVAISATMAEHAHCLLEMSHGAQSAA